MKLTIVQVQEPSETGKKWELDQSGGLKKTVLGHLLRGTAVVETFPSLETFVARLSGLRPNETLISGTMKDGADVGSIVTKKVFQGLSDAQKSGKLTRSNDHFDWPDGPGILMLDFDAPKDGVLVDPEECILQLESCVPELLGVSRVIYPSGSSHIFNVEKGVDETGLRGFHVYVPIDDASAIPTIAKVIEARLWNAGHGRYEVSKSGALLPRTLIDQSIYTPCHLIFAGGAVTGPGLEQRRGAPMIENGDGGMLRAADLPIVSDEMRHADAAKAKAKAAMAPVAEKVASTWRKKTVMVLTASGVRPAVAARIVQRAQGDELVGAFEIQAVDPKTGETLGLTVTAILADKERYDGWKTLDPMEPEYNGYKIVGMLLLSGKTPRLKSFAHGGKIYDLFPKADAISEADREILISEGETAAAVDLTLRAMMKTGLYFDKGDHLVRMSETGDVVMERDKLEYDLGRLLKYKREVRVHGDIDVHRTDPPRALLRQVLAHPNRGFPKLVAQVDHPVPRLDRSIIADAGHDPQTGLFVTRGLDDFASFVADADGNQIAQAIETCIAPFGEYDLSDDGLTAILCAVITAVVRPAIDLAPLTVIRSPSTGVGKGLIATALGMIALGKTPSIQTYPESEAELRKQILALLMSDTRVILYDNADGRRQSKTLAAAITAPVWSDRELGRSTMRKELPNRALLLLNGRSVVLSDGLARRVLPVDIRPKGPDHVFRRFANNPVRVATDTRDDIVGAALTLIAAVEPSFEPLGQVGSFPEWDRLVRGTVAWVAARDRRFKDPIEMFRTEIVADVEIDGRIGLLEFLESLVEGSGLTSPFAAADIVRVVSNNGSWPEFEEHLKSNSGSSPMPSARSVGTTLSSLRDQPVGDLCLRGIKRGGRLLWSVERAEAGAACTAA